MDSAFRVATRMAMLYQGKVIQEDRPERFKKSQNAVVSQFVSGSTEGPILEAEAEKKEEARKEAAEHAADEKQAHANP